MSANDQDSAEIESWMRQLESLYKRPEEYEKERGVVRLYLKALKKSISENYIILKPFKVGGTGIVFEARHKHLPHCLAVKMNRPTPPGEEYSMVEHERTILPHMDHHNIIKVLDAGIVQSVSPHMSFIVEPFIQNPKEVGDFFDEQLNKLAMDFQSTINAPITRNKASQQLAREKLEKLEAVLTKLTQTIHQWLVALKYVHDKGYVYLDVKPSNAIIDSSGHVFLIDFGSVQKRPKFSDSESKDSSMSRRDPPDTGYFPSIAMKATPVDSIGTENNETINVFFTSIYAHPLLKEYVKDKPATSRVKAAIKRSLIERYLDHYAMGKSILQLLDMVAGLAPNDVPQLALFRSLHFLATRLLDGKNDERARSKYASSQRRLTQSESYHPTFFDETFSSLNTDDYEGLKYLDFGPVIQDLEKELGPWDLERMVPELQSYSREVIRITNETNTALTERLRLIIEHPLFARLKFVSQLGLVTLIYPTGDHSRYDHAFGTFSYAAAYIRSLFNDHQNPIFRNLVNQDEVRTGLLAAILHDLGQYPLAHDMEEVHPALFGHSYFSVRLLDDPTLDSENRTLASIITDKKFWGVNINLLKKIMGAHSLAKLTTPDQTLVEFKVDMLSALIDGPIDADKADYIMRDSEECRVPYGRQLDITRLLHVITIALPDSSSGYRAAVGVYAKGRASAESFSTARYLLYSSIYWHHTSRILKAMVQYAVAINLSKEYLDATDAAVINKIRSPFLSFITSLTPPFDTNDRAPARPRNTTKVAMDRIPPEQVPSNRHSDLSQNRRIEKCSIHLDMQTTKTLVLH